MQLNQLNCNIYTPIIYPKKNIKRHNKPLQRKLIYILYTEMIEISGSKRWYGIALFEYLLVCDLGTVSCSEWHIIAGVFRSTVWEPIAKLIWMYKWFCKIQTHFVTPLPKLFYITHCNKHSTDRFIPWQFYCQQAIGIGQLKISHFFHDVCQHCITTVATCLGRLPI